MMKLMNLMMLSCTRVTELVEKKSSMKLSFIERFQLKLHTLFCAACGTYEKQSKLIDEHLSNWMKAKTEQKKVTLSKEAKSKIVDKIKKS